MHSPRPQRRQDVTLVHLGDELLLRPPDARATHVLNRTAQLIWELCDGKHSAEDIAEAVRAHFMAPPDRDVLADVQSVLQVMRDKGLLTWQTAEP